MAMATSAPASTGTSLMPSPTMATFSPSAWHSRMRSSLRSGLAPPSAVPMPRRAASASAAAGVSPESSSTARPCAARVAMASAASSRTWSCRRNQQRGSSASASSSHCPSPGAAGGLAGAAKSGRPRRQARPSMRPSRPRPGRLTTSSARRVASRKGWKARAMGCSERASRAAARRRAVPASSSPSGRVSTRLMRPVVRVPVLSRITRSTWESASMASARVTSTPRRRSWPWPAVSAVGVASARAQGQVTTSTERVIHSTREGSMNHHTMATPRATNSRRSTNRWAMRAAIWARRGRLAKARSVRSTMPETRASRPAWVTRTTSGLSTLWLPPVTVSPTPRVTGRYSPVSIDSSRLDSPSSTTPSAGTAWPGLTSTRSPAASSPAGRMRSSPAAVRRIAERGRAPARALPVWPLRRRARAST